MNRFKLHKKLGQIAAIALLTASSNVALAQDDNGGSNGVDEVSSSGDWEFALAPLFLWGMGISGDSTIGDVSAPLDVEFKDLLDNLEAIFTVHFEARKDKWTIFSELQYADIRPEATLSMGPVSAVADIGFKNTMVEVGVAYAFRETQNTRWEVLGGFRYTDQDLTVDATLTFPPPVNEQNIEMTGGDNWSHALVGARFIGIMSNEWTFIGRTDVGYGGSDNTAFNAAVMFDYRFRNWGSAFIGYRYLKYDFDNKNTDDRYAYNAYQSGPLAGLMIHW